MIELKVNSTKEKEETIEVEKEQRIITEDELEKVIKDKLEEFYLKGMAVGAKTISQEVMTRLYYTPGTSRKGLETRINRVIKFCRTGLKAPEKIAEDYNVKADKVETEE